MPDKESQDAARTAKESAKKTAKEAVRKAKSAAVNNVKTDKIEVNRGQMSELHQLPRDRGEGEDCGHSVPSHQEVLQRPLHCQCQR